MKISLDTWAWLTLRDKKESKHEDIKDFYSSFRDRKGLVYTSDYVLDETITLLFRRLSFELAKESLEMIDEAVEKNHLYLEYITPGRFKKAKDLRVKYRDKPRISFTDLTTMVVMAEVGITKILTEDDHFTQVGMGFQKVP